MTQLSEEQQERVRQIRKRLAAHRQEVAKYQSHEWAKEGVLRYYEAPDDIDFLLTVLDSDSQAAGDAAGQPKPVLYSQYIAVAESLEATTKELNRVTALAQKRKQVLIDTRMILKEARFAPMLEDGCVQRSVAEYVRMLVDWTKKLESARDNAATAMRDKCVETVKGALENARGCAVDNEDYHLGYRAALTQAIQLLKSLTP